MSRRGIQGKARAQAKQNPPYRGTGVRPEPNSGVAVAGSQHVTQAPQVAGPGRTGPAGTLTHEQIAQRAREIWEQQGRLHGQDERNWLEAEAQLKRELGIK